LSQKSISGKSRTMPESKISAARRVFDIVDLKERILGYVSKEDLLRCMRVNKRWFDDSVRDVYKSMDYERVVNIMESESVSRHVQQFEKRDDS
jgi:hypothetical protein